MDNFGQFFKISLFVSFFAILFLILAANFIVLSKVFPNILTKPRDSCCPGVGRVCTNLLDAVFPTDITFPPYSLCKPKITKSSSENSNTNISNSKCNDKSRGQCDYQKLEIINTMGKSLTEAVKNGYFNVKNIEWPYNWLKIPPEMFEAKNQKELQIHKAKRNFALMVLNQSWWMRFILKSALSNPITRNIPDFIYLLPGGTSVGFIIYYFAWFIGALVALFMGTVSYASLSLPPSTWFTDPKPADESAVCTENYVYESVFGCRAAQCEIVAPSNNYLQVFLQFILLGLLAVTGVFTGKYFNELIDDNRESWDRVWSFVLFVFSLLLVIIFIFLWFKVEGYMFLLGIFTIIGVALKNSLTVYFPLFRGLRSIFDTLYCNRQIIALSITAIIISFAKLSQSLNDQTTNTMWTVWSIMLIIKLVLFFFKK